MYHGAGYRKLGKKTTHRLAMFANMASSLIEHERIETTLPKAKDLRRVIEKLITKGKKGDVHNRRLVFADLRNDEAVEKLFNVIAPRFKSRKGGYTRILKVAGTRVGDGASMAVVQFVDYELPQTKTKEELKKEKAASKAQKKEEKKAKAASRPTKAAKDAKSGVAKRTGKAGANSSMKGFGSRGT